MLQKLGQEQHPKTKYLKNAKLRSNYNIRILIFYHFHKRQISSIIIIILYITHKTHNTYRPTNYSNTL